MNPAPNPAFPWSICYEGVCELAEYEGYRTKAYQCDAGKWTCGRGETDGVTPITVWTPEYIDQKFCASIAERTNAVLSACTVPPTQNQLAALVSFAYNYGAWKNSTVMKCHNRGDFEAAARAFDLVNQFTNPKTGKREVSNGLTLRRKREAARYLMQAEGQPSMPQAVAPEEPLRQSTTIKSGTVIGGAGVVAGLGQVVGSVQGLGDPLKAAKGVLTETLGIPASWLLPMVCLVVAYILLRDRIQRRLDGWV